MDVLVYIIVFSLSASLGGFGAWFVLKRVFDEKALDPELMVEEIRKRAGKEADEIIHAAELDARRESLDMRTQSEQEIEKEEAALVAKEIELDSTEERLSVWEVDLDGWDAEVQKRLNDISSLKGQAKKMKRDSEELESRLLGVIEERAGESSGDLCSRITNGMVDGHKAECADRLRNIEAMVVPDAGRLAKRILGISIGRVVPQPAPARINNVFLLSQEELDRFQREGREIIDTIEDLTGVHLAFDELEGSIRVENIDGVARETGRRILEKVLRTKSGGNTRDRINTIAKSVKKVIEKEISGRGLEAFKVMSLEPPADELVNLVGRLYYRTSYAQNQYYHAMEASIIAGLMASELGVDVKIAQRAGLLHDIGKALTHEIEGSHAVIGAEIAERNRESKTIVNAIAAHHDDEEPTSIYAHLTAASDASSGSRPGARRELVEAYMDRIQDLERVASSFKGVSGAYAVQAGRELRVLVDEKSTNDEQASNLASGIAEKISDEMVFPGQIKVTVIRTTNALAVAS